MKKFTGNISVKKLFAIFIAFMTISYASIAQIYYGPQSPPPKGASIVFTGTESDGQIGRAGGKDYTITNVVLANTTKVYWGMLANSIKLSLDGLDYTSSEVLQYNPVGSNLAAGILTWTGTTIINIDPIYGSDKNLLSKFIITVKDQSNNAVSLISALNLNLPPNMGGLVTVTDASMVFKIKMEMFVSEDNGITWVPHLDYYDAQHTPPGAMEAWSTYDYSFYWTNDPPELKNNLGITVDEEDTAILAPSMLKGIDSESPDTAIYFIFDPTNISSLPAHGILLLDGTTLTSQDTVTQADINDSLLLYVHDGSETIADSIPLILTDGNSAVYHYGNDTLFFVHITITPVDDPPVLVTNKSVVLDEGDTVIFADTLLLTTDAESDAVNITYTLDPNGDSDYPKNGLLVVGGVPLSDGGTFTQADINNRIVSYIHDGSETTNDGFVFNVKDENGHYAEEDGNSIFFFHLTINSVNDPPVVVNNQPLTLKEGGIGFITGLYLATEDPDNTAAEIKYTLDPEQEVDNPIHGQILLNGNPLSDGGVFTQDDLNNSRVTYQHDGSEDSLDFFVFTVTDPQGGIASDNGYIHFHFSFHITQVNDPPYLINPIPDHVANIGLLFQYTIPDTTFLNVDPGDSLAYGIGMADGSEIPGWLMVDNATGHLEGTPAEEDADTLTLVVTALDSASLSATDTFNIFVTTSSVDVEDVSLTGIDVYPNPFKEHVTLRLSDQTGRDVHLQIINITGKVIYENTFNNTAGVFEKVIPLSGLADGIYFLHIGSGNQTHILKLIKR